MQLSPPVLFLFPGVILAAGHSLPAAVGLERRRRDGVGRESLARDDRRRMRDAARDMRAAERTSGRRRVVVGDA